MSVQLTQTTTETRPTPAGDWLAGLLWRRSAVLQRYVYYRERMARLPRRVRRALLRRLALSVSGAALLLALGTGPLPGPAAAAPAVPAQAIAVVDGLVAVANDGLCSLIEAFANANDTTNGSVHDDCAAGNPAGADTIVLPPGGQFTLTDPLVYAYHHWTGLPAITGQITLEGNGATIARAPSGPSFNLLSVWPDGELTVVNTVLRGGDVTGGSGGAIFARGDLVVAGSTFVDNNGAITASGDILAIRDSLFSGNAPSVGATIRSTAYSFELRDSVVSGNHATTQFSGGVGIYGGQAQILDTVFRDNVSPRGMGGALQIVGSDSVSIAGCLFDGNESTTGMGGAIGARESVFELEFTVVRGNSAYTGGGIFMDKSTAYIRRTTISGNTAVDGGGVFGRDGALTVWHSTVSGNTVERYHPQSAYGGTGGGIAGMSQDVILQNATIAHNRAEVKGGGLWIGPGGSYGPGGLVAERSLISGNGAPLGAQVVVEAGEEVRVDAYNVLGANGRAGVAGFAPGASDVVPAVGVLAAQVIEPRLTLIMGPTPTHVLPPGSLAIDLAPTTECRGLTDQRGMPRSQNGDGRPSANECDAGAFERGNEPIFDNHALLPFVHR